MQLGFPSGDKIDPDAWLPRVLSDLASAGVIRREQNLIDYEAVVMNPAYVHINRKSQGDIEAKKRMLCGKDIYSIGRYGSWTYCSIEDNIAEAKFLAVKMNGL